MNSTWRGVFNFRNNWASCSDNILLLSLIATKIQMKSMSKESAVNWGWLFSFRSGQNDRRNRLWHFFSECKRLSIDLSSGIRKKLTFFIKIMNPVLKVFCRVLKWENLNNFLEHWQYLPDFAPGCYSLSRKQFHGNLFPSNEEAISVIDIKLEQDPWNKCNLRTIISN